MSQESGRDSRQYARRADSFQFAVGAVVVLGLQIIWKSTNPPSLGDWGSLVQALAATLAFIWLVYGQYENQKTSRETKNDLAAQMEVTRELVGALIRIASGTQVQAADVLANALPQFAYRGALSTDPASGSISFRNDGDGVALLSIESGTDGLVAKLERPGACPNGGCFKIWVGSRRGQLGTMRILITFKNKFGRVGWALLNFPSIEKPPDIEMGMGQLPG